MQRTLGVAVAMLVLVATACSGNDDSASEAEDAASATTAAAATTVAETAAVTTESATIAPATTPATTEPATTAPSGPRWAETDVEGCLCSDGSPLPIFERVADPSKVVLYFEGGGACFSAETCDPNGTPTYSVNKTGMTASLLDGLEGYFDDDNPENPLASHSFVYVPYCTGDVHVGNATHDYGNGVVVEHRGYANAVKALDYLVAQYPDAEQLVVTGTSAGSVPSPLFAALAADLLPDTDIVAFGDSSGAYPDVDAVNAAIGALWGFPNGVPDWPELAGLTAEQWSFPEQSIYAGQHAPDIRLGRFDFAFDEVQATFGALAGVGADQLVTAIDATEDQIEAAGVAVASYVAPGDTHTVAGSDDLYELEVEGVRLIDWLTALINDPEPPPDVHCETCT